MKRNCILLNKEIKPKECAKIRTEEQCINCEYYQKAMELIIIKQNEALLKQEIDNMMSIIDENPILALTLLTEIINKKKG